MTQNNQNSEIERRTATKMPSLKIIFMRLDIANMHLRPSSYVLVQRIRARSGDQKFHAHFFHNALPVPGTIATSVHAEPDSFNNLASMLNIT